MLFERNYQRSIDIKFHNDQFVGVLFEIMNPFVSLI